MVRARRLPSFKEIHSGYDKMIYTADGLRYSDAISVTIDSASFAKDVLTFKFSGHQGKGVDDLDVATITPTVLIGLYGWDTKDYVIGPHERLIDDNKDGAIDSKDSRNLEAEVGEEHPRITTVSAEGGKWEVHCRPVGVVGHDRHRHGEAGGDRRHPDPGGCQRRHPGTRCSFQDL